MKFLLTIIQAVGLGCASAAAGRRVLHYLQLESYQLPGYVKSVRRNAMRALIPPIAMAAVGVAALRLSGLTGLALLLETLTAALLVWQAAKEKAKKPFVATERVKRLLAVHAAVNTVLALALLTVSPVLGYLMPAFEPALLMLAAGALLQLDVKNGWKIFRRDRCKHASPNSAQTESVCAGLLGLRLAGDAWYHGVLHKKDYIGDAKREIELEDIPRAGRLMYLTAVLALVVFGAGKALLIVL